MKKLMMILAAVVAIEGAVLCLPQTSAVAGTIVQKRPDPGDPGYVPCSCTCWYAFGHRYCFCVCS